VLAVLAAGPARAAELSTTDRLQDRREVAAGTRAYSASGSRMVASTPTAGTSRARWAAAVAGSDKGIAAARAELARTLDDPAGQFAEKVALRTRLSRFTRLSLPDDRLVQRSIEWGKQNLADLTQTAEDLQIRWTNQGKQFPAQMGTVPKATWVGAGFPDYPWIFATDAEYTSFASLAVGQFEPIMDHMRALRDISEILNPGSGVVVHESVSDGSIWFGKDTRHTNPDGSIGFDFNTDETVKFPSTLALIWRWTGDDGFRDELYGFARRNLRYVVDQLDADDDGWPEGLGNVERSGMGEEKLDNTVYFIRGLYDLADMALSKHDGATGAWAMRLALELRRRFDGTWWYDAADQYADSLGDPGDLQVFQKHWIGQTPMEVELTDGRRAVPGLAPYGHGSTALAGREDDCYSGEHPLNPGLYHTGCGGGPMGLGERTVFGLTTSIQSIGEGNYGRLGPGQQQRYTHALAETMFSEPATGGTPDEQPGAMPEIFPSPDQGANIDRCWTCRSMFMQAWGNYGTAWAVVHQQLGVRPQLGDRWLEIIPQVPEGQTSVKGEDIRLGSGAADVLASHAGNRFTTTTDTSDVRVTAFRIGHTLPRGSAVESVVLDGVPVTGYESRPTNRGLEVRVAADPGEPHTLVVTTGA
jgi:hypothetical protein